MDPNETARKRDEMFEHLRTVWNLKFHFMLPTEDPRGIEYESMINDYGFTITNRDEMVRRLYSL